MEQEIFTYYCDKIREMNDNKRDWFNLPKSIVADYLRNGTSYGFGGVLVNLLTPAYTLILNKLNEKKIQIEDLDLYEIATTLAVSSYIEKYRLSAYLFTVYIVAVSLFGKSLDEINFENIDENELMKFDCNVSIANEIDSIEKPIEKQLKRFSLRLLDFSRSNQLVHFRPLKSTTLRLFCHNIHESLCCLIEEHQKIYLSSWQRISPQTIYRCKTCKQITTMPFNFLAKKTQSQLECQDCDKDNSHNRKSMYPLREEICFVPDNGYTCSCGNTISVKELEKNIVCPKCKQPVVNSFPVLPVSALAKYERNEMICAVSDYNANETAKTILNKTISIYKNFGLHVLYLAFGFLKWKDSNGTEYNSPILLCPINLSIDKTKGLYYFEADQSSDNSFEVNKTLIQMLTSYSNTCSIILPEFDSENYELYFSEISKKFKESEKVVYDITKDWTIDVGFGIGMFHYQKLQLQHDIETNKALYLEHPIIRRLCGDYTKKTENSNLDSHQDLTYMLLDADSSQESVIKAFKSGRSFILQGPPGSGKSQTITNIISTALGGGKTVLLVTEKASARSIIIDNLYNCSFSQDNNLLDFVLDFDSFKTRNRAISRRSFVSEINRCLVSNTITGVYADQLLSDERSYYSKVATLMGEMRNNYNSHNYLRLMQNIAQYAEYKELSQGECVPTDSETLMELRDLFSEYYRTIFCISNELNYKNNLLFGCKGDDGSELYRVACAYIKSIDLINQTISEMHRKGWENVEFVSHDANDSILDEYLKHIRLWIKMPKFPMTILSDLTKKKISDLLGRAKKRLLETKKLNEHRGKSIKSEINADIFKMFDLKKASTQSQKYKIRISRISGKYRKWKGSIFACFTNLPSKCNYKTSVVGLEKLILYDYYLKLMNANNKEIEKDMQIFGYEPTNEVEWNALISKLSMSLTIYSETNKDIINLSNSSSWLMQFDDIYYSSTIYDLKQKEQDLFAEISNEKTLRSSLRSYFNTLNYNATFKILAKTAMMVVDQKNNLSLWQTVCNDIANMSKKGWLPILDELINEGETEYEKVERRIYKTYYKNIINKFIEDNGLTYVRNLNREKHEQLLENYAKIDKEVIASGGKWLYESLLNQKERLMSNDATSEHFRRLSINNYSIKQTISENWDYIKYIKPCFLMSPLNVSQYIDANIQFDLVVFDEASQIFTEDALAAIMRGRQVIIVGDSKQLPPCDFFKAGESIQNEDEQYYEEEVNQDNSLLIAADKALNESSISLAWHYRSCDESLIDFANKEMNYRLISFPSATKNKNDGIRYVQVEYSQSTCYVAGNSGAHINSGEADRILDIIYNEITNDERKGFSIGVVAFSNAQAFEIEQRWDVFKQREDKKDTIDEWEKLHIKEPLIFCNLDTVQGDERDTTIISICYSPDANNKFILPYLGCVRLNSGRKRLNVAVTRARHQMIVVSMLTSDQLKVAINKSTAIEENKAGALMLQKFLEYAKSVSNDRNVVCCDSNNEFVKSICRLLDDEKIYYDTEIGRSECKINIGIRKPEKKGDYILGIIIDDPSRTDFDSVREYTRLTEQVLSQKYGWQLYRVYPTAWVNDYEDEKKRLLDTIKSKLR